MVHAVLAAAAAAALLVPAVSAQASAYGQCGGPNWTGSTTCVAGYTCVVQNPYYSQCVPGTAPSSSTSSKSSSSSSSTKPTTTSTKSTSTVTPTTTKSTTTSTSTTSSAPSPTTSVSTTPLCGQYDSSTAGPYTLFTNLWGEAGATSGTQCAHWTSLSGSTAAWSTTWTWAGGSGVKSFSNIQLNQGINKVLSTISTIPSTAKWTNTASGSIVADVAYDLFTSTTPGGSTQNNYEIMIWLANYNAGPISSAYGASGAPTPVASNLSLGGYTWNLYYGFNGWNYVYSFLPVSGTIPSFSADINLFLKYLTTSQSLPASQYLTTLQFGTEPTTGSATLDVSSYSAAIN